MNYWISGKDDRICIYIDECGDLGFNFRTPKKPPSEYYTLAAIRIKKCDEHKKLSRIIKKTRQESLHIPHKWTSEPKFTNSNDSYRKAVLSEVAKLDLRVYSLTLCKRNLTYDFLKNDANELYTDLMKELFKRGFNGKLCKPIYIYIDRFLSESKQDYFQQHLLTRFSNKLRFTPSVNISHVNSKHNKMIQVADFIAGGIRYKYEYPNKQNRYDYFDIIKSKVNENKLYFKKKRK